MVETIFAGRYRFIEELGRGSNGPVWRCYDENLSREIALKRFAPNMPNIVAYEEAGLLTRLASDHILKVSNADTYLDIPYIATDVALSTAEHELEASPWGLPPDSVLRWSRHLLVGLSVTHDFGLVHRDVKPANIFLDRHGRALLGDFGLARLDEGQGVPAGGTPRIRAPEMFDRGVGTKVSDLYSAGVSMYRLLTGVWPFDTEAQVLTGRFARLRSVAPHVPRRLADRIERALRRDPAERYSSAQAMNRDLGASGLLERIWYPIEPHEHHSRCWLERRTRGTGTAVCVVASGPTYALDVRRDTATRPRITPLCTSGVRTRDLAKRLAATFDELVRLGR